MEKGKLILLSSKEKRSAIRQILKECEGLAFASRDIPRLYRAVLRRERIETTGIGHGVAIAHGKIRGLESVPVALGVSREGVDYQSVDGKPVHLLFLIASSPQTQDAYIGKLSRILAIARSKEYRTALDDFEHVDFPSFCEKLEKDFDWLT